MPAAREGETHRWGTDYACMVCGVDGTTLVACNADPPCPQCKAPFSLFQPGLQACPTCDFKITADILIDVCTKYFLEGDNWCEGDRAHIASCHTCQHPQASVFFIDGMWSCVVCFDRGWSAVSCERCYEFVTGDMEKIKYFACQKCETQVREHVTRAS